MIQMDLQLRKIAKSLTTEKRKCCVSCPLSLSTFFYHHKLNTSGPHSLSSIQPLSLKPLPFTVKQLMKQ